MKGHELLVGVEPDGLPARQQRKQRQQRRRRRRVRRVILSFNPDSEFRRKENMSECTVKLRCDCRFHSNYLEPIKVITLKTPHAVNAR